MIDWNNLRILGKLLKIKRKERKLSLRKVAPLIGISYTHLYSMEAGKVDRPKVETLHKLIAFYGLDHDEVYRLSGRIPDDVYYRMASCPELVKAVREWPEK